ncbi:MAG TPA: hypothetical protein VE890_09010, partial [Thermoguttaceae bacterium]|nr:hypothetical protein [Thermoguttaceae bacterium]
DDDAGSPVGWIGWGGGIGMGKTPDAFRICRFVIANSTSKMPQTTSLVQPLDGLGDTKAAGTPVADSATDYSNKQGANNWFYGFYAGDGAGQGDGDQPLGPYTDDDFGPMTHVQTVWGYNWAGPAKYLSLKPEGGHPEVIQGRPAWAVRRWKSTVSGPVRLVGFFRRTDEQGDGTGGRILIDGVQVYETTVGGESHPGEVSFDVVVPVHEGSLIDFAITPGPTVDTQYDATQSRATIYKLQSTEGNLRTP